MVVKNIASSKTDAQRDRFWGLSAPATSDNVRNLNFFDLSDFIHANLSSNIKPCHYYDLNFQFDTFSNCKDEKTFILFANNHSLHKNFDSLIDFCESLSAKPNIVRLTETKLKDIPYANINIPKYNFYHSPLPTNAGGVAMYISSRFVVQNVYTQLLKTEMCKDMFVEPHSQDGIQCICGAVSHCPKCNFKTFNENLETQIMQLNKDKNIYYITGDFNVNIGRNLTSNSTITNYQYMLTSNGVSCMITKPTRVISNSSSLIDYILTNHINNTIHSGVIQTDLLSDHYPFFCVLSENVRFLNQKQASVKPTYKYYTNFTSESFKVDLNDKLIKFIKNDLSTVNTLVLDAMYDKFINMNKQTIDEHVPKKIASRKRQN